MSEKPAPKSPSVRKSAVVVPPRPAVYGYLPYVGVIGMVVALVLTIIKSPTHGLHAAAVLVGGIVLGLSYVAFQHTITLSPEQSRLRVAVYVVTVLVALGAIGPLALTLFPTAPAGTIALRTAGDSGTIDVVGRAAMVFLEASGRFKGDVGSEMRARYTLSVVRDRDEEIVEGSFERVVREQSIGRDSQGGSGSSDATASRHVLRLRGAGRYRVALDRLPDTLDPPITVAVHAEPVPQSALIALFGALAMAALAVDVMLRRRGIESAYAAALLLLLAGTFYLHGHFTPANAAMDLLAAGLVGVFAGGVGGEVLARITHGVIPE